MSTPKKPRAPIPTFPAAVDPAALRLLPLDQLDPSPWNRAIDVEDPSLAGLAESIRAVGILQPLLARPLANRYQLLVGARRRAAAQIAGLPAVPVRVVELDDRTAEEVTCIENLQRENLHFLDEAACIGRLVEGTTPASLAARIGRTARWVALRARLAKLSALWQQQVRDLQSFAATWTAAHLEQIATLEPAAQDALLDRLHSRFEVATLSVRELARIVAAELHSISGFPWRPADATLDPIAGACTGCPFRSSQHPTLFDTRAPGREGARLSPGDRCLDPTCAARKLSLHLDRQRARLRASHARLIEVSDSSSLSVAPGSVREWSLQNVAKDTAGAVPGLLVTGPHAGTVRWYRDTPQDRRPDGRAPSGKRTLAQRRERLDRRRAVHATSILRGEIAAAPPPALPILVRLAIVFGTTDSRRRPDGDVLSISGTPLADLAPSSSGGGADGRRAQEGDATTARGGHPLWTVFEGLAAAEPATIEQQLWNQLWPVLRDRMTPVDGLAGQIQPAWCEAQRLGALLGLDTASPMVRAVADLPNPKSWAAEERAEIAAAALPSAPPERKTKVRRQSKRHPEGTRRQPRSPAKAKLRRSA